MSYGKNIFRKIIFFDRIFKHQKHKRINIKRMTQNPTLKLVIYCDGKKKQMKNVSYEINKTKWYRQAI